MSEKYFIGEGDYWWDACILKHNPEQKPVAIDPLPVCMCGADIAEIICKALNDFEATLTAWKRLP